MAQDVGGGGGFPQLDPTQKQPNVNKVGIGDIAFLHQFLRAAGLDPGPPSTTWTAELGNALGQWQQQRGLPVTSQYDQKTRNEVDGVLAALAGKPGGAGPGFSPIGGPDFPDSTPEPEDKGNKGVPADLGGEAAPVAPAPPAAPAAEPLTEDEIRAQILKQFPSFAFLIDDPEVGKLLREAVNDPESWAAEDFQAALMNTQWFRTRGSAGREWEITLATDPTSAQRRLAQAIGSIDNRAKQMGLTLTNDQIWNLADSMIRFNLSEDEVNRTFGQFLRQQMNPQPLTGYGQSKGGDDQAIAAGRDAVRERVKRIFLNRGVRMQSHAETADARIDRITDSIIAGQKTFDDIRRSVDYQSGALGPGDVKALANQLGQLTAQYLVPFTRRDLEEWAIRITEGTASTEGFTSELQNRAISRFPWLRGQLEAGESVAQIFGSHKAALAQTLEMAPEQVDLFNNPKFTHITDFVDDKGQRRSMTLAEVTQWARNQPEFGKTRQANERGSELVETLLQTFGKVA